MSRERVLEALAHTQPDRIPVDLGSTTVTGIHVSCVAALREYYGLECKPVKAIDCGQMLGEIEEDLKSVLGVDVEGVWRRSNRFGFVNDNWKMWRLPDGLEVLVPGEFNTTTDANGDTLLYPQGDTSAAPSARMPAGGHFFDAIIRQEPIVEEELDAADNVEEFREISEDELDWLAAEAARAAGTGRAVVASFGGTGFGDIAHVPGVGLKRPRGIRDISEWYMSLRLRRGYVAEVFERQGALALANLRRIAQRVGGLVDVVMVCGTDFGTQTSSFCSVPTFCELWLPHYRRVNDWIHRNTRWRTMKHSCGAVAQFIPSFVDAGFDILNPVQCSAAGMDPERLKDTHGARIVFWGGGVDTQSMLPFGAPAAIREQVLRRCETFARAGGFVFGAVHNIQAGTPVRNLVALFEALREVRGLS